MKNFNREIHALRFRTIKGMIEAVLELQREAEPGTPLDTGNLRASWFSVSIQGSDETKIGLVAFSGDGKGEMQANHQRVKQAAQNAVQQISKRFQPVVLFGYTANYAVFVHENIDAKFQRPGARARWLFMAIQSAQDRMLQKIAENARFR